MQSSRVKRPHWPVQPGIVHHPRQGVLGDDYQLGHSRGTGRGLDEYATALRPVIQGWQPSNVFLYGVTGVGKTVAIHDLFEELQESAEEYDDVDLNCTGCTSSYQAAVSLVNEIRSPSRPLTTVSSRREPMSETGCQQKRIFNELYHDLVLLTVCQLAAEGDAPERTKLIYERYQEVLRSHGGEPLKRRRVHDHLSDLSLHGIPRLVDSSGAAVTTTSTN